ncbi:MAG: glycosyltransferase family 4 protein, partial [Ruminiclostridium sp.]
PAGHYSYNDLYNLGKPIIADPLGGGIKMAEGFEKYKNFKYALRNLYYKSIHLNPKWKEYYCNCNSILIGTKYMLEHLPKSVHNKTIEFFDTVVDTNKFIPSPKKNLETINIIYSGHMNLSKGCILLIEAYKLLLKEGYTEVRLIMLGEGSQYSKINKIIKRDNLEKYIYMAGRVTNDAVKEFLQTADIFCMPCLKENGGTSILEAMSCAIPIITTNHGGPSISVTEECGIKIKAVNYKQYILNLKQALKYLIDNPKARRLMGQNARNRVEAEYSYTRLEEKIVHLYKNIFDEVDKYKAYDIQEMRKIL